MKSFAILAALLAPMLGYAAPASANGFGFSFGYGTPNFAYQGHRDRFVRHGRRAPFVGSRFGHRGSRFGHRGSRFGHRGMRFNRFYRGRGRACWVSFGVLRCPPRFIAPHRPDVFFGRRHLKPGRGGSLARVIAKLERRRFTNFSRVKFVNSRYRIVARDRRGRTVRLVVDPSTGRILQRSVLR